MDKYEARRLIKRGGRDPEFRKTAEYKSAAKYTLSHYRGVARGAENLGGASTKSGCSLWTCLVLVAMIAVPTVIIQLI